jgi:hypothetical protein
MITHRQALGNWTFVYLGAVADAWDAGQAMGLNAGNIDRYDTRDTASIMRKMARGTRKFGSSAERHTQTFYADIEDEADDDPKIKQ